MTSPPLILCSGTLGETPILEKIAAASAAGFDAVSIYGHEIPSDDAGRGAVRDALAAADVWVAEVDGVVQSLRAESDFDHALDLAVALGARSITVVETGDYDPHDTAQLGAAVERFGDRCDRAAAHDVLVHLEPFSWSALGRLADAAAIVEAADRSNGGILLDLWHHLRGPDQGVIDPHVDLARLMAVQLADTTAAAESNVRDECMARRQMPGRGHGQLRSQLDALGPLPPLGVEVFGEVVAGRPPKLVAIDAYDSLAALGLTRESQRS